MSRVPMPPELGVSAFSTAEARSRGVGRGRLRGRDLAHPHHGIHVVDALAARVDIMARCEWLLPALGPDHWFSHGTAARIWGIPLAGRAAVPEHLHVLTVNGRVPLRHARTVGWVTADDGVERGMFGLLPVVSPADAWCQLAQRGAVVQRQLVSHEWLVAAADYLLTGKRGVDGRRAAPLCSIHDLRSALARRGRGRGTARLRLALEDARAPVDSPYESLTRLGLIAGGLPEPHVQVPVLTRDGLRHADLGYPDHRLLLEYQGEEHRRSRSRWLKDLTRVQLFQDAGYQVFLIGADDVVPSCSALVGRVRRALGHRAGTAGR